jgi:hypothetical protein
MKALAAQRAENFERVRGDANVILLARDAEVGFRMSS